MDDMIRSTRGYNGREDFVAEAIRDRVAEERTRPFEAGQPALSVESSAPVLTERTAVLALWGGTAVATAPAIRLKEPLLGLHNRDYPTLWATDLLATIVAARGEALSWIHFVARAASAAWTMSEALRETDEGRSEGAVKASVGFPGNLLKRSASEARFTEHMLGRLRQGTAFGPIFAMGLVGISEGPVADRVAPTKAALALLKALREAGLNPRPPHSPRAWLAFRDHVRAVLPSDLSQWLDVLRAIGARPTSAEIVVAFQDRWPRNAAQTNLNGYVSRGREWGLIEPRLVDGRYQLTPLGMREIAEASQ